MAAKTLRVLSYNIHKGFDALNLRQVLKDIRQAIHATGADLVFLQEVQGHHKEHSVQPQFEYLADRLWPHHAYGKNAVYDSGHHGNAILSKFPFKSWENIDVSNNRFERRGLLHGVIHIPRQHSPIHAICLHLDLFEGGRQRQFEKLCRRIAALVPKDEPLLIGGDFNDWRTKLTAPFLKQAGIDEVFMRLRGEHPKTFPSWLPALRLDRIYFRGMNPIRAEVLSAPPWNTLSDHHALYAEFEY